MKVLDSSSVLAFLFAEPGGETAEGEFKNGIISTVNVVEVISKQIDKGADAKFAEDRYAGLNLETRLFDEQLAVLAGKLRAVTDHRGLSLGDRACLALAIREGATALTADRNWADLDVGCNIELIR